MELNLISIATICTIVSTVITIFSYIKSTKTFYRLILILITVGLFIISIILCARTKSYEIKELDEGIKSIELKYEPLNTDDYISYIDSLIRDSSDFEFQKRYEIAKRMYSNNDKADELMLLIDYALNKSKYFWAIKYATEIYSNNTQTKGLKKIIKFTLSSPSSYKYSIIAASEIYGTNDQEEQLIIIIDSCLIYEKFDDAYIAADLIYSNIERDEIKSKILRKMNNYEFK